MNPKRTNPMFATAAAFLALGVYSAYGQTAPSTPVAPGGQEEAVKLDPFNVSADSDVGFVAASSLAGGRIATALKDTPVAYSVITKEFIDAFAVTDVVEAAQWSTNVNQNEADNSTRMYGNTAVTMVRIRGIKMGLPTRNFFTISRTSDSYNLDRVDMARGPNSVLFGAGGVAGTMNSMTKQAETARKFSEFQVRLGSFSRYRFTADINQPINDKIALRANLMYDEGNTWKPDEWNEKRGLTLAAKYNVTPKFSIRAEFEYVKTKDGVGSASIRDNLSAWDGQTTFNAFPNNGTLPPGTGALTPAQRAAAGLNIMPQRFVESSEWGNVFLNFQNRYITKGVQQNADVNQTNRLNGVPVITQGFNLNRQALIDAEDGVGPGRWNKVLAGSPWWRLPERTDSTAWTNRSLPLAQNRGTDFSLFFNYNPTENLYFEVAGSMNKSMQYGENTQRRGLLDLNLELHRTLPDGSANPTFLKPYIDVFNYRNHRDYTQMQLRANVVYKKDLRIGRLQFGGMAGGNNQNLAAIGEFLLLPLTSISPDARTWTDVSEFSEYGAYTRWTFNDGSSRIFRDNSNALMTVYNPVNGIREAVKPAYMYDTKRQENNYDGWNKFRFSQVAANFDLFKNRLVLIGAFRRDELTSYTRRVKYPGDSPAGWDGTTFEYKPDAPADYYELTYQLKNAAGQVIDPTPLPAGNRPRGRAVSTITGNRANVGLPQYANDRFQDDYTAPVYRKPVNTNTYGAVFNVARWLGVFANKSTTFNTSLPGQRIDGSLVPPTASEGQDYGIRFTLPNNRLAISIGRYESFQEGATIRAGLGAYNTFAATPVLGDLSETGRNIRGMRQLPQDIFTTLTDSTEGYEFEATANLTTAWRLVLNAGYADSVQKDRQPDVVAWIPTQDAIVRQVMADAGITIDSANNAFIPAVNNDPLKINIARVQATVDAWNNLQDNTIPNLLTDGPRPTGGMTKWTGNVATDYRFRTGPLRGLRIGGGVNFRSGQVIGFKTNDTIRNPANPNVAIDDPTVDGYSPVYGSSYVKAVASMSYTWRLPESNRRIAPKTIQFDFNIDNLLNEDDVVYGNINDTVQTGVTLSRPRIGEDITSPARRTIPGNFGYLTPRNYLLSAKLNF